MRILASARKHGIADADMIHALTYPLRDFPPDEADVFITVGPSRVGRLLEIGVATDVPPRIVHAMLARRKYVRLL